MDLKELVDATATVTFDYLGEQNTVEVYTAGLKRLTPDDLENLNSEGSISSKYGVGVGALSVIVKSWDVKWGGEILPLDHINDKDDQGQRVYRIPFSFFDALIEACDEVFIKDPTKASASPAGLAQEASVGEQAALP